MGIIYQTNLLVGVNKMDVKNINLEKESCLNLETIKNPLERDIVDELLGKLKLKWNVVDNVILTINFSFKNYHDSILFVNEVATISDSENHHPKIVIDFKKVEISFSTHEISGLSLKDFIMAAKSENSFLENFS